MKRREAIATALAALPGLIMAMTAWIEADAARRAEGRTYQGAAEMLGEQAEEIRLLRARVAVLETAGGRQ